jgi:hypothetical protein
MTNIRSQLFTLATVVMIAACGGTPTDNGGDNMGGPPPPPPPPPRVILAKPMFGANIQEIFDRRGCTSSNCHGGSSPRAGMLLASGSSHAALVNVASTGDPNIDRVVPGNTAISYLWLKVSGVTAGPRMPQGGPVLDDTDLGNIENWINTNAPNN